MALRKSGKTRHKDFSHSVSSSDMRKDQIIFAKRANEKKRLGFCGFFRLNV
ncbi:hypothetical protein DB29_01835 [Shouchella clausii]|nr:hypothetical protein DB29_01835 [Shouchella clausii]